ncbi:hypothetical protein FACS189447_09220 [Spirochaetia bacterium]|nr:hypothetical protein FACS189447_09220 [Spirochaetia bacterium]
MKEKKMLMSIAFALCMAISVYAGGGAQAKSGAQNSGYTGNLPFAALKYYNIGDKSPATDAVLGEMNKVMRKEINAEMVMEYIPWDGFEQKYQLVFASGEAFDAIYAASWASYGAVATKNGFMELKPEFIQKNAPYVWSAIPEAGWNQVKVGGKIFMIPQSTREFNHYVIGIRGDLREKYKLPPVDTYGALENYLAAVKANNPELTPFSTNVAGELSNWVVLWNLMHDRFQVGELFVQLFFVDINSPNPKVVNFLEQKDAAEFFTMQNKWQKQGFWSRSALSATTPSSDNFNNGLVAAYAGNSGTVEYAYTYDRANNNSAWKVELYDFTEKANKKVPTYPYNAGGISINRNAKNPDRVLMMVDLFRKDKDLNHLAQWGIKGVQWDYEADGETLKDMKVSPENNYGDALTWGPFRNVNFMIPYTNTSSSYYRHIFDNSITRELTVPVTAFLFDDSNVKNEEAAVSDVYQQYVLPLVLGFSDPSELPGVIQRLKTAGIDKLIAEMQKQLDANR